MWILVSYMSSAIDVKGILRYSCMTDSTGKVTPSKSTKLWNSDSSVQIHIKPTCQFELVPMTDSTGKVTPSKSIKLWNSDSSVQIHIKPTSQFELVPRDTGESEFLDLVDFREESEFLDLVDFREESEFLDLVDFGEVVFSVETHKWLAIHIYYSSGLWDHGHTYNIWPWLHE